jgi:hypothetical protein
MNSTGYVLSNGRVIINNGMALFPAVCECDNGGHSIEK